MRTLIVLSLFALALPTSADCTHCSVRFGNSGKTLDVGMDIETAQKIAGDPDEKTPVMSRIGLKLGDLWAYKFTGYNKRTVLVQFNNAGTLLRLKECIGQLASTCSLDLNGRED